MFDQLQIKTIVVLATCLLLCCLVFPQNIPQYREKEELTGKIKKLTIVRNDDVREIYMYNEKGLQTEYWLFRPLEVLLQRYTRVYNDSAQLVEETILDKGYAPVNKTLYAYNNEGLLIGSSLYSQNNTLLEKYIYTYNRSKLMTDSIRVDAYGNLIMKCTWQYDGEGRRIKTNLFWNDTLVHTKEFAYNKEGRVIRETKDPASGNDPDLIIYSYDEKGNRRMVYKRFADNQANNIEQYGYDSSGNVVSYIYLPQDEKNNVKIIRVFDERKKMTEQIRYHAGVIYNRYTYKYDGKGNELEMNIYNGSEKTPYQMTWQYEFDKTGNWIKKTRFGNGVPDDKVNREIEYY